MTQPTSPLQPALGAASLAHQELGRRVFHLKTLHEMAGELAALLDGFLDGPYVLRRKDDEKRVATLAEAAEAILDSAKKGLTASRYKGLGEMNPETLWETTMNPASRRFLQVRVEDAVEADELFTILMGDAVEPRRAFIEANALAATNLDI